MVRLYAKYIQIYGSDISMSLIRIILVFCLRIMDWQQSAIFRFRCQSFLIGNFLKTSSKELTIECQKIFTFKLPNIMLADLIYNLQIKIDSIACVF
jgi:hypothetical protein